MFKISFWTPLGNTPRGFCLCQTPSHNVRTDNGGGICQRWGVSPQCCRLRGRGSKGRGNRNPCPFVPSLRYFLCIKKVVKNNIKDIILYLYVPSLLYFLCTKKVVKKIIEILFLQICCVAHCSHEQIGSFREGAVERMRD